jgi:hypothetical protein
MGWEKVAAATKVEFTPIDTAKTSITSIVEGASARIADKVNRNYNANLNGERELLGKSKREKKRKIELKTIQIIS